MLKSSKPSADCDTMSGLSRWPSSAFYHFSPRSSTIGHNNDIVGALRDFMLSSFL